jgi:hypothetical protein
MAPARKGPYEIECGSCRLLYTIVKTKTDLKKLEKQKFICPACGVGQDVYLSPVQRIQARGRIYPEGYFT